MDTLYVETNSGKVKGYERDGMVEYLGIPYAEPPVEELRLKRAVPVKQWEGIFDAKDYGAPAVQMGNGRAIGSEDCLTLNIRRPLDGENLPVLVYIHGGGYSSGMATGPLLDGKSFVRNGIVYVSFHYRLNVWGFYDFTGYSEGKDFDSNCGISDHIIALKWIRENIRAFGGDPDRITISGESAGGISVIAMMAIPELKGTFQQVIASSALPNAIFSAEMSKENIELFMEGMGWTAKDLPKLRTIDAYEVLKGSQYMAERHQYKNPGIFLPAPAMDDLIPERPMDAIRKGCAKGIKLMIGTNLHEGTMFVQRENTGFPNSWEMIEEMFSRHGYQEAFPKVKKYYERKSARQMNGMDESLIHFATDYAFQVPAIQVAKAQQKYGDVFLYRFEYIPEFARRSGMMCAHAMDLPFDFNNREDGFYKTVFREEPEEVVAELMNEIHMSWVRFVKTGDPNKGIWHKYEGHNSSMRIFDRESRTILLDSSELMDVWEELRFYQK